ncbi:MAG: Ig-like domain-containing protein [Gemmatimonadetes bacterium]|nr:Ig-like domain-containing protein [Gemmatimonadota bacterium]
MRTCPRTPATLAPLAVPLLLALLSAAPLSAQQAGAVEVLPARAAVTAGEKTQFRAVVRDAAGKEMPGAGVHWLATPFDIAGADTLGRVTTYRPGQAYVLAIAGGKVGIGVLEIAERPPARLSIEAPEGTRAVVAATLQLEAAAATEIGDPVRAPPVTWRSLDARIAEVSPAGLVRALAPGRAHIAAQAGALTAETTVTVRANPVRSLAVSVPAAPARVGDVVALAATARDAAGEAVRDVPARWSVAGPGASLEPDGRFVASRPGLYPVVASVGGVAASAAIRVLPRTDPRRLEAVAHAPLPPGVQAAELWPVGDVVYVSTIAGTVYVFDVSNPAAPGLADSLVVDARLINDVSTTPDGRIGVLSREGASSRRNGLVFFDATDARHPRIVSEYTEGISGGVHSAFIYQHYVFATDDATGSLRIIDFSDPRAPRQVARWEIPRETSGPYAVEFLNVTPERYLHDVYVQDGLAYLAYWKDGLVILDVGHGIKGGSISAPRLVSQLKYSHAELYPPGFMAGSHSVFRHGRYVFLADESYPGTVDLASRERFTTRGLVHVVDVSDLERPRKVAQYDPVEFGAHNLWAEDGLLYIGAYDGGVRVLDVSGELRGELREQARVIGSLYTGSLAGYRPNVALAWSAIPHNGHVLASDINTGLWVAKLVGAPTP